MQRAKRQQSLATLAWQRAEQGFALLARGAAVPDQDEVLTAPVALEQHPLLHSLQARSHSAQARLEQASLTTTGNASGAVSADLTEVDALSGATITSSAVTTIVNNSYFYVTGVLCAE